MRRLLVGGVAATRPSVRFVSSVEGWVGSVQMDAAPGSPAYWAEQIVRPVDFAAAAAGLVGDDVDAVLEIGPRPVLCGLVAATARAARRGLACLPSIDRRGADDETFLRAAGRLAEGGALDIRKAMQAFGDARAAGPFVELPTYRFDHTLLQPASWPHTVSRASTHAAPPQPLRDAPVGHRLSRDLAGRPRHARAGLDQSAPDSRPRDRARRVLPVDRCRARDAGYRASPDRVLPAR